MSGRRATVPHSSLVREQRPQRLSVLIRNERGTSTKSFSLDAEPGSVQLRRELIQSVAVLNGPDGLWRSVETCRCALASARHLLKFAEEAGIESLHDLSPDDWLRFIAKVKAGDHKTRYKNLVIGQVRRLVLASPVTPAYTRLKVGQRYFAQPRDVQSQRFHTREEFDLIKAAAVRELRRAVARVVPAYQLATGGVGGEAATPARREAMEDFLAGANPCLVHDAKGRPTNYQTKVAALGRQAAAELMPKRSEIFAALIALICVSGDNLSTAQNRVVPRTGASSADDRVTVLSTHLDKPRRGHRRHMPEHVDSTSAKGEVLALIVELTEAARLRAAVVQPEMKDCLFLWWSRARLQCDLLGRSVTDMRASAPWTHGLPHFTTASLHRTYITRISQREHHQTPQTRADSYLRQDPDVVARWEAIAREGIDRIFQRAQESTEHLIARSREGIHAPSERQKLVTPSGMVCGDPQSHPTSKRICRDPFLACLGCANAYAYDEHVPILVYLHRRLEQERSGADSETWKARYQLPWAQLTAILRDLPTQEWRDADLALTETAKQLVERAVFERRWDC